MEDLSYNKRKSPKLNYDDREYLKTSCDLIRVKYILNNENIILVPSLFNKTIILKTQTKYEKNRVLIKYIQNTLRNEGATVIIDEGFIDKSTLNQLDPQIHIVISFEEKQEDLTLYLPFKENKTISFITKQIIKGLVSLEVKINYKIVNNWNRLKEKKYWSFLIRKSPPILIVEIANSTLYENCLTSFGNILVKSIIKEFGYKPIEEEINMIISKLRYYESELSYLNRLYIGKELQENNNDTKKQSAQELNIKENTSVIKKNKKQDIKNKSNKKSLTNWLIKNMVFEYSNQQITYPIYYFNGCPVFQFNRPISPSQFKTLHTKHADTLHAYPGQYPPEGCESNNKRICCKLLPN